MDVVKVCICCVVVPIFVCLIALCKIAHDNKEDLKTDWFDKEDFKR